MISFKYGRYEISAGKARGLARKYNSYFKARNGTVLYVIPRTSCEKVEISENEFKEREEREHKRDVNITKSMQNKLI